MGRGSLRGSTSIDIRADIDSVYNLISNHIELSKINDIIVKVRMRSERPESAVNEETIHLGGETYKCMVKHIFVEAPSVHTYTVIGGDAKGSSITERLTEVSGGTRVDMVIQWRVGLFKFKNKDIMHDCAVLLNDVKLHLEC